MPNKKDREYRNMTMAVRADETETENRTVEGYATTFNEPYVLFEDDDIIYREQVDPRAFDDCDMSDTIMQYDHRGRVFARVSNETLTLKADEKGLNVVADLGGTEIGRELYEEIAGGYTTKMSFGFRVSEDSRTVVEDHDNNVTNVYRTITKISKLFDVSAVSLPANDATDISARSYCDGVIAELEAERLRAEELMLSRKRAEVRARALGGKN